VVRTYFKNWTAWEVVLLMLSIIIPITFGVIFDGSVWAILAGVSMPVCAVLAVKGKIESRFLAIISLVFYVVASWQVSLFGLGRVILAFIMPLKIYASYSWPRNRHSGRIIKISVTTRRELILAILSQLVLSVGYFFLLRAFGTPFLIISVISVDLNVLATYFMARRSPISFATYIILDFVQAVLWLMLLIDGDSAATVMISTFVLFLLIDIYGFVAWRRLRREQTK